MSSPYTGFGSLPKPSPIQPEMDWMNSNRRSSSLLPTAQPQRPPTPWDGTPQAMDVDAPSEEAPWTPKFDLKVPSLTLRIPTTTAYGKTKTGGGIGDDDAPPSARSLWPPEGEKGESSNSNRPTEMEVDAVVGGGSSSSTAMAVDSSNDNSPTAMAVDGSSVCTMDSGALRESWSTAATVPCGAEAAEAAGAGKGKRKNSRFAEDLPEAPSGGIFLGRLRSRGGGGLSSTRGSAGGGSASPRSGKTLWDPMNWNEPRHRGAVGDMPLSPRSQPPPLAAALAAIVSRSETGGPPAGARSRRDAVLARARSMKDATSARWRKLRRIGKEDKGKGREVPAGPP